MSKPETGGLPVDTLLYTRESADSRERSEAEIKESADPDRDAAIAILQGGVSPKPARLGDEAKQDEPDNR